MFINDTLYGLVLCAMVQPQMLWGEMERKEFHDLAGGLLKH